MSIDTRPPQNPAPPPARYEEPAKPKLDLSLTQVLAGALAAMTAAYLGSRLSVAGTVVGAALASIVAAVAGSVYTASLRSTHERARTVWRGRVAGSALPTSVQVVGEPDDAHPATAPARPSAPAGDPAAAPRLRRRGVPWKNVAAAALVAFALAGVALTGVELVTGSALSGGDGTTLNQVTTPRTSEPRPAGTASAEPSEASPSAAPSTDAKPSEMPSPTATTVPQPSVEPTDEPTASTPTPSPSSTPPVAPTPTTSATPDPEG